MSKIGTQTATIVDQAAGGLVMRFQVTMMSLGLVPLPEPEAAEAAGVVIAVAGDRGVLGLIAADIPPFVAVAVKNEVAEFEERLAAMCEGRHPAPQRRSYAFGYSPRGRRRGKNVSE